ncbi:MAG TPA: hypothetical protein PK256_20640 [Verrucomicrobiota bacterium]|nr:hypothetical protein [Verrucomicrobiota bacterium]
MPAHQHLDVVRLSVEAAMGHHPRLGNSPGGLDNLDPRAHPLENNPGQGPHRQTRIESGHPPGRIPAVRIRA